MANPNLASATNIYGGAFSPDLPTSLLSIVSNPSSSGKIYKVHTLMLVNIQGSITPNASVQLWDGVFGVWLAYTMNIPADSAIVLIGRDNPIYLLEGKSIRAQASAVSNVALHCMWDEIS